MLPPACRQPEQRNTIELFILTPSLGSSVEDWAMIGWHLDKVGLTVSPSPCLPSLEIPSCPGHRRAWLSQVPPGTLSARKSSPRQKSADQKRWAGRASSFRPCQSGRASLKIDLVSTAVRHWSPPVNVNVIEREIFSRAWLTTLRRETERQRIIFFKIEIWF